MKKQIIDDRSYKQKMMEYLNGGHISYARKYYDNYDVVKPINGLVIIKVDCSGGSIHNDFKFLDRFELVNLEIFNAVINDSNILISDSIKSLTVNESKITKKFEVDSTIVASEIRFNKCNFRDGLTLKGCKLNIFIDDCVMLSMAMEDVENKDITITNLNKVDKTLPVKFFIKNIKTDSFNLKKSNFDISIDESDFLKSLNIDGVKNLILLNIRIFEDEVQSVIRATNVVGKIINSKNIFIDSDSCNIEKIITNYLRIDQNSFTLKKAEINFLEVTNTKNLRVINSTIINCKFNHQDKTKLRFDEVTFINPPLFANHFEFSEDIYFVNCNFKSTSFENESQYNYLKNKFSNLKKGNEETMFASYEMECHLKHRTRKRDKIFGYLYLFFNNMGRSIWRPILILLALNLILSLLDYKFSLSGLNFIDYEPWQLIDLLGEDFYMYKPHYWHNITSIFINSLGPLKFLPKMDLFIPFGYLSRIIYFFHGVVSTLLLYLFISGIKKRFQHA